MKSSLNLVILSIIVSWLRAAIRGYNARLPLFPEYNSTVSPCVSILIPAWNERSVLSTCIANLLKLKYTNWECIICAGGADGTFEQSKLLTEKLPNFQVIPQQARGKNAALNTALALAKGEIIVLLDADCVVEPEWLSALIAPIISGLDAALGNYFAEPATPIAQQYELDKISTYFIRRSTALCGGAIAISRAALNRIGGRFDDSVKVGTDWNLNIQLEKLGLHKCFVPTARHTTPFPPNLREYIKNEIRWRRAHLLSIFQTSPCGYKEAIQFVLSIAPYIVGIILVVTPITLLPLMIWRRLIAARLAWVYGLYVALTVGRRTGQIAEIIAYTGDWRWLRLFWTPSITLLTSLLCGVASALSLKRMVAQFKGFRPQATTESNAESN